jgi:hypothetical protein
MCSERLGEHEASRPCSRSELIASVIYGGSTRFMITLPVAGLALLSNNCKRTWVRPLFDPCVATGAAIDTADAVASARQQIRLVRDHTHPRA